MKDNEKNYLTAEGKEQLQKELEQLQGPEREDLSRRLRSAIEMGDLSENADYKSAKEAQSFLEGRIREIEYTLQDAIVVEKNKDGHTTAAVGAKVTVQEDDYPPETYYLVGSKEADPINGKISNASPIGNALFGKKEGAEVIVDTPNGKIKLKILEIE
ncbi:MAG: transcription elongation factor GreA [Chloroflexota bacterium]|nr:transcription elongation factor GreA [Chloroflexota bacterium]